MREPYERIAGGPFRDDTHRAAVEATAVDLAGRQLRGNSPRVPGSPEKAADGKIEAGGRVMRVEAEDGRVRLSCGFPLGPTTIAAMEAARLGEFEAEPADWLSCQIEVHNVYALAQRALADAGPLPLASSEPWVEDKQVYRERLRQFAPWIDKAEWQEFDIDEIGENIGLPRPRLVPADAAMRDVKPATTQQGGSDG